MKTKWIRPLWILPAVLAAMPTRAHGYVDLAPTMSKVLADAQTISVVEVTEFNREQRTLALKEVRCLKGAPAAGVIRQQVASSEKGAVPRQVSQWAEPGAQGVMFSTRTTAIVCVGQGWYQLRNVGGEWKLGVERPELPLTYYGTVSRLIEGVEGMLQGKDVVLTMLPHGVDEGASFDTALNKAAFPGLVKVQRLRANLRMPAAVMSVSSNSGYMLGMGPVDEEDLPKLAQRMASPDAGTRAEAAEDLRQMTDILGRRRMAFLKPAAEALLKDQNPRARLAGAGALLRLDPEHAGAQAALSAGLVSAQAAERRDAAAAVGTAGTGAAALVVTLAPLVRDADPGVKVAALQALGTIGPAAVAARDAVVPLLEDAEYRVDAAEVLGRMGPRAQPVPAALAKMIESEEPAVRLAALRGMAQIGGAEAKPAVEYIVRELPNATEIDGYNMVIYLALLGPVAREPAQRISRVPIRNPLLPSATAWAMNPTTLPWQPGGRAMGPDQQSPFGDLNTIIWEAYVHELGERLRPCAITLAPQLMNGTAGDITEIPPWGYRILAAAPKESLRVILPHLADEAVRGRERAAVALGYMGPAAGPAKEALEAAITRSADEKEKKLLQWALEQVTRD